MERNKIQLTIPSGMLIFHGVSQNPFFSVCVSFYLPHSCLSKKIRILTQTAYVTLDVLSGNENVDTLRLCKLRWLGQNKKLGKRTHKWLDYHRKHSAHAPQYWKFIVLKHAPRNTFGYNTTTRQLPMGAGHCPWGGFTDWNGAPRPNGLNATDGD